MRVFKNTTSCLGGAIPLLRAAGFVRNGHLNKTGTYEWVDDLVPELGPVASAGKCQKFAHVAVFQAFLKDSNLVPTWSRLGPDLRGGFHRLMGLHAFGDGNNRTELSCEETIHGKHWLRVSLLLGSIAHPPNARTGLLDKGDAVQQIGDQWVSAHAFASEIFGKHPLWETARTRYFDAILVNLDKDIGSLYEPVPMHDSIGDGFAQSSHGILRDLLALELLDPVGRAGVALDKPQALLNVSDNAASKILAVQNMNLARSHEQQTGDIGLIEEPPRLTGKEKYPCVVEEQLAARAFRRLDVH